jgi:hypothetical protein
VELHDRVERRGAEARVRPRLDDPGLLHLAVFADDDGEDHRPLDAGRLRLRRVLRRDELEQLWGAGEGPCRWGFPGGEEPSEEQRENPHGRARILRKDP